MEKQNNINTTTNNNKTKTKKKKKKSKMLNLAQFFVFKELEFKSSLTC